MSDLSLANDQIATVPIIFKDNAGAVVKASGGSATSSDPSKATAAIVSTSGNDEVEITPVADGTGITITYTNAQIPGISLTVDIVEPSPTADSFDLKNVEFRAK